MPMFYYKLIGLSDFVAGLSKLSATLERIGGCFPFSSTIIHLDHAANITHNS